MSSQSKSHDAGCLGSFAVDPITVQRIVWPIAGSEIKRHLIPPVGVWKPSALAGAAVDTGAAVVAGVGATVVGAAVVAAAVIVVVATPVVVVEAAVDVVGGGLMVVVSAT